jgi:hypothetical protein
MDDGYSTVTSGTIQEWSTIMAQHTTTRRASIAELSRTLGAHLRLTARPDTFAESFCNTAAVWLLLMTYWALTDVLIAIFPPGGRPIAPDGWLTHLIATLAGLVAIAAMHRIGFPAAWDERIPARHRLLLPVLVGVAGGIATVGVDVVAGLVATAEAVIGQPFNVAFPGSVLVYSAAAIHQELRFLLFPLPVLLWLISGVMLRGRWQALTFWTLAVLSSAAEPALQAVALRNVFGPGVIVTLLVTGFAANLASAAFLRHYGLLAAILVRLGHYLVWHILYGNFLAYV